MPFQGDLPDPGIKLGSPALQVDSLPTELSGKPIDLPKHFTNGARWEVRRRLKKSPNQSL